MRAEHAALMVLILVILIVVTLLKAVFRGGASGGIAYERRNLLFSAAERSFLGVLEQILGKDYRVIGKVRMADIIRPNGGLSRSARTSALNRITSKHFDFVVCDPRTLEVVGVIELDDSSHDRASRRRRDEFIDEALSSAGVPIVRIPAQRAYAPAEIRLRLSALFGPVTPALN